MPARRYSVALGVVLILTLVIAAPVGAQAGRIHVVQRGETLYGIARRYGVSLDAICAANGIADARRIYVGQRLVIPTGGGTGAPTMDRVHVIQRGETLYRIALRYGTTVTALTRANGIASSAHIYAGQRLKIPDGTSSGVPSPDPDPPATQTHVVRPGETLSGIARRHGVTLQALIWANDVANPSLILPGQVLVIRGAGGSPSTGDRKRIVIDLSEQHLYAFQGEVLVYSFVASTGKPGAGTRTGTFRVLDKYPNAYASTWDLQMPYFLGIYWAGSLENGIHALPILSNGQRLWAGYLGTPVSFGCIILGTENARQLYAWAEVGTPVVIRP